MSIQFCDLRNVRYYCKAVAILEVTCNMKVIVAVADGAFPNSKFFKMNLVRILFA